MADANCDFFDVQNDKIGNSYSLYSCDMFKKRKCLCAVVLI